MNKKRKEKTFDEEYVLCLFRLALKNRIYTDTLIKHLQFHYLPKEEHKRLWKTIKQEYKLSENGLPPNIPILKQRHRTDSNVLELLTQIREIEQFDEKVVFNALEDFLKQNMLVETVEEVVSDYNIGKKKLAEAKFVKGSKKFTGFTLVNDNLESLFHGFEKRNSVRIIEAAEDKLVKVPFGIDELDYHLKGGAELGDAVLFLAKSGGGKSFLLTHCAINAARRGFPTIHFQAEGKRKQCMDRFDSCWTGVVYYDVKEGRFPEGKTANYKNIINRVGKTDVLVDCFESFKNRRTMADIYETIYKTQQTKEIKYVTLDYLELVDPADGIQYKAGDERLRQIALTRDQKDIATELNVVFVSATQSMSVKSEQFNDPDFVLKREHLGESKKKVDALDIFITLNQSEDEKKLEVTYDQRSKSGGTKTVIKTVNQMRLFCDKLREHESDQVIFHYQDLSRSRFYSRQISLQHFFNPVELDSYKFQDNE